jgi:nicotinate-nucleotide adenylyltransferase
VAAAAARAGDFQQVLLIPAAQSPHKTSAPTATAAHRLKMCHLATADNPLFRVSDLETSRPGPSYTIDTARALKAQGWPEVHWLIGADQLPRLNTWHQASALLQEVIFWVVRRPGSTIAWHELPPTLHVLKSRLLTADLLDISSTDIRQRIATGQTTAHLLAPPVELYIRQHGLYSPSFTG